MTNFKKEWFGEWFDSPFYHILYKHRDHEEARAFIDRLNIFFQWATSDKILDLACGKGRHSIYLNKQGLDVVGLDLSAENVKAAKAHENSRLHFYVHDMREVFRIEEFDYIVNLFTSFGYFDTQRENEQVICSGAKALKIGGRLLVDFLNPYKVIHKLVPCEEKKVDDINFKITKRMEDGYILKNIDFQHKGQKFKFQEKVKAIRRVEFLKYFKTAQLQVLHIFGDYDLNEYDCEVSDRLIFVVKK